MTNPDPAELKALVAQEIDASAQWIEEVSGHIMRNPESGYREFQTAQYVQDQFDDMGVNYRAGLARTGVKAQLKGRKPGPSVAILGEMDSLIMPGHPFADPETNAAHACGHNAQIASMLGAGRALKTVINHLDGNVVLFAVPAEECIELPWRMELRERKEIEFLVGKAELVRLGEFDDIDMAMLTHTKSGDSILGSVGDTHNGAVVKQVQFRGRAAHAGGGPWFGVNALKAAIIAMSAIDAQRETFRDDWTVRIHPILTKGGDVMTAVPADARIEMMVRGRTLEVLDDACEKVDRSLRAGAMALGGQVDIETVAAYFPHKQDENLIRLAADNIEAVVGTERIGSARHSSGSTDLGDLSHIIPVIQPTTDGARGTGHTVGYHVEDHYKAAVDPAKYMAFTVIDLLTNDAAGARTVLSESAPRMSRDQYVTERRSYDKREVFGEIAPPPDS